ncbi:unnamed protein product [Adineta steineri]|uniref:C2H2-type domain-containing protein n=1 Tax=Adineta steineri TaxID=433720 RepID=A0A819K4U4_9BILA|nr:unnamed protein product [Adineta steineri]CAF3941118.1 unnamed protein product [Adineta steineri]
MTVCIPKRDRCRLCFSLILRDRSTLFSSICCQKYYHLFKHIQRTKIPFKKYNPYKIKISNRTVCFQELILRYLNAQIDPIKNFSNFICYDCSRVLLDIEQCAKYLRKTIKQLKVKFNKSNRLVTSSLSATIQRKKKLMKSVKIEPLPISNSDDDDEFDDIDDDDDDEETDHEHNDTKPSLSTSIISSHRSKSLNYTPPSSSLLGNSLANVARHNIINRNNTNFECNNNNEDDDDGDDEEEEEDEDAIINSRSKFHETKPKNLPEFLRKNVPSNLNPSDPTFSLLNETNPNLFQLRLAHMMANVAALSSSSSGHNNNNNNNDGNNVNSMMNTFAHMQQNILLKILNDPIAAAQAAQVATAAATSITQNKVNLSPMSLLTPNNKQSGSGRKRKSTPEKRIISNHQSTENNNDISPPIEYESINNSTENINNQDILDHPLELTYKNIQRSNPVSSSTDIQNLMINPRKENGSPSNLGQFYQHIDEDRKESATPNDSSLSLSPSDTRSPKFSKRKRLSTSGQYDYLNTLNNLSMVNLPQTTTDLLSPNHHHHQQQTTINDDNNSNIHQRQQHKLEPRSCAECGKVLFTDKALLLHCQTHAKNVKQCWICGINDDDIKKHIHTEHGNQKFTNTGFRCQHCEKVFPVFADLETHTKEHSKKKPFECPICNKRFGQQGNLSCHLRIHSGVKPFTCTSCGKAFRHSNSLRRHARTVHSASRGLTTTTNSLLLPHTTTSLSNDLKSEPFDDVSSGLMIPSDDNSSSDDGMPSPSISNAQVDSD